MAEYDSEDYSSSEDEDYVPSGGDYSEDDVNELVKEEDDDEDEDRGVKSSPGEKKKKKTKCIAARKRKKGGLVLDREDGSAASKEECHNAEEDNTDEFTEEKKMKIEEAKKKREEDLWSSFLSDVGHKPKTLSPVSSDQPKQAEEAKTCIKSAAQESQMKSQAESAKVTITKVFDFAGEQVTVKKEVDSSSKEAKEFIMQQQNSQEQPSSVPSQPGLPTGSGLRMGRSWTFQHDNDPTHKDKLTLQWLQQKKVKVLEWPSQSPDLNIMEPLWENIKHTAHARRPKTLHDLEGILPR